MLSMCPTGSILALFWPAATLAQALERAALLIGSPVFPVLLEALNECALGLGEAPCVVIGCAGAAAHIDEQERRLQTLSAETAQRCSDEHGRALRRALSDFSHPADDGLVARLGAAQADSPDKLESLTERPLSDRPGAVRTGHFLARPHDSLGRTDRRLRQPPEHAENGWSGTGSGVARAPPVLRGSLDGGTAVGGQSAQWPPASSS